MVTVRTYIISSAIFAITRTSAIVTPEAVLVLIMHCLRAVSRIIDTIHVGLKDRKSCRIIFSNNKIPTVVLLFTYEMMLIAVGKGLPRMLTFKATTQGLPTIISSSTNGRNSY